MNELKEAYEYIVAFADTMFNIQNNMTTRDHEDSLCFVCSELGGHKNDCIYNKALKFLEVCKS